jgi:hypothetical protein
MILNEKINQLMKKEYLGFILKNRIVMMQYNYTNLFLFLHKEIYIIFGRNLLFFI